MLGAPRKERQGMVFRRSKRATDAVEPFLALPFSQNKAPLQEEAQGTRTQLLSLPALPAVCSE